MVSSAPREQSTPFDQEAEEAVLGAILIDPKAIGKIEDNLRPEDFGREAHRLIFAAALDVARAGTPVDTISVANMLEARGHLEFTGGRAGLNRFPEVVPAPGHVEHYAQIVGERSRRRRMRVDLEKLAEDATDPLRSEAEIVAAAQVVGLEGLDDLITFEVDRGLYRLTFGRPASVEVTFDQLRVESRSSAVTAEAVVSLGGRVVHHARENLTSTRERSNLSKALTERVGGGLRLPWLRLVDEACSRTVQAFRSGEPAILLRDAPKPDGDSWIVPPLVLSRLPTILFGDGATAKSYLALAAALTIHTGRPFLGLKPTAQKRVAYLDWEFEAWEHRERMRGLVGEGQLPDLVYVRCSGSLRDERDRLRQILRAQAIEFVVVDSIGFACEGPPEEAQSALGFYEALRSLGVGALCIAHVNRGGDTERPFGSAFWHNGARATWYAKKQQDAGGSGLAVGLFNKKSNSGPLARPLGFRLSFSEGTTRIELADVRDVPELAGQVPLKDRMSHALRAGALTYMELAQQLEADADSVSRIARRYDGRLFRVLPAAEDGKVRVALPAPDSVRPDSPDSVRSGLNRGRTDTGGLSIAPVRPPVRPALFGMEE